MIKMKQISGKQKLIFFHVWESRKNNLFLRPSFMLICGNFSVVEI